MVFGLGFFACLHILDEFGRVTIIHDGWQKAIVLDCSLYRLRVILLELFWLVASFVLGLEPRHVSNSFGGHYKRLMPKVFGVLISHCRIIPTTGLARH